MAGNIQLTGIVGHELTNIAYFFALEVGSSFWSDHVRWIMQLAELAPAPVAFALVCGIRFVLWIPLFFPIYKDQRFYEDNKASLLTHLIRVGSCIGVMLAAIAAHNLVRYHGQMDELIPVPTSVGFQALATGCTLVRSAARTRALMGLVTFLYKNCAIAFEEMENWGNGHESHDDEDNSWFKWFK